MPREIKTTWREWHLSEHFRCGEFFVSNQHPELAAAMMPTAEQVQSLTCLCRFGLEPIRAKFMKPIIITRGVTATELNAKLMGAPDSQHFFGEAADFEINGEDMEDVFFWAKDMLRWPGELIYYRHRHLHIALPSVFLKIDQFIKEDV